MLLSIVTHGKNDGYMRNFLWRCATVLNKQAAMLDELGRDDVELLLTDWGSEIPLVNELQLSDSCWRRLRVFYVPPAIANQVGSPYSSSHAANVAARRALGEYLMVADADTYWQTQTMQRLLAYLEAGQIGPLSLAECFFWASRKHIPKSSQEGDPSLDALDAFITANECSLQLDPLNLHEFLGTGLAITLRREMWHACRGFDEQLVHWGWNDIHLHKRLCMRYRWGGDLRAYGMPFFHLEHYANRHAPGERQAVANPQVMPERFEANGPDWGLGNCVL